MEERTCVLVELNGSIEVLPSGASPFDALIQGPFHSVGVGAGWTLYWSSASYELTEVNEFATTLAKQTVKGDACLLHEGCQEHQLDDLLQSRHWRVTQPVGEAGTPCRSSSSSTAPESTGGPWQRARLQWQPSGDSSCSSSSAHAILKRARSLQHIAAANSTRQRILRSMTCSAGACADAADVSPSWTKSQQPSDLTCSVHSRDSCHSSAAGEPALSTPGMPGQHQLPALTTSSQSTTGSIQGVDASSSSSITFGAEHPRLPLSVLQKQQQWTLSRDTMPFQLHNSNTVTINHGASDPAVSMAGVPLSNTITSMQLGSLSCTGCIPAHCGSCSSSGGSNCSTTCGTLELVHMECEQVAGLPSGQVQLQPEWSPNRQQPPQDDEDMGVQHDKQQAIFQEINIEMADIGAAGATAVCASCPGMHPAWDELSDDVIGCIAGFMGSAVSAVMPMYLTCRAWRRALLEDDHLLLGLAFRLNIAQPFKPSPARRWHAVPSKQHPALLLRACKLGNVSALVTAARLLDAAGCPDEAMRCWRRAAKANDAEAQLVFGLGLYRGIAGLAQDTEDAHLWLVRALKQVQKPDNAASGGSSSSSSDPASAAAGSLTTPASSPGSDGPTAKGSASLSSTGTTPPDELAALTARVLRSAGLVLGYLAFDGEGGLKVDRQEAVRYFKLAAAAGCKEAEQVLGWIYSTGQYG